MDTSIYVANRKIQMVCGDMKKGRLHITYFHTAELPEEAIINGIIMNEDDFYSALRKITERYPGASEMKKVRITIGSSPAMAKAKKVPKMSKHRIFEWMQGEFPDNEAEDEEYLYDYAILDTAKDGDTALLCAIKKSVLQNYIQIFDDAGISISCIDIGLSSQIKLIEHMRATEGRTFLMMTMDGNNLDTVLYDKGIFKVLNRTRLINERGSEGMTQEVARVISTMIQFNVAENSENNVEFIYMCGFRQDEEAIKEYISGMYSLRLRDLRNDAEMIESGDQTFVLDDYLYAVGNLIRE